jgi:hypothetical protein
MSSFSDRINLFRQRASDISTKLSSLADQRRSISIPASEGDQKALKEIILLDQQYDGLRRERDTLSSAIEHAETLQRKEIVDEEQKHLQQREIEAHNHAAAIAALNCEIDQLLVGLRQVFERRASLLVGLARTELVDPSFVARFGNKAGATRAACCAGLHRYLALETVAPSSMHPLASTNETLLGIGKPAVEAKSPRPKFKEDA